MVKVNRSILKEYSLDSYLKHLAKNNSVFFSVGDTLTVTYYDIYDDEVSKRTFSGVCIAKYNNGPNSSFVLRNTFKNDIIDQRFFINSTIIDSISRNVVKQRKNKLYKLYHVS